MGNTVTRRRKQDFNSSSGAESASSSTASLVRPTPSKYQANISFETQQRGPTKSRKNTNPRCSSSQSTSNRIQNIPMQSMQPMQLAQTELTDRIRPSYSQRQSSPLHVMAQTAPPPAALDLSSASMNHYKMQQIGDPMPLQNDVVIIQRGHTDQFISLHDHSPQLSPINATHSIAELQMRRLNDSAQTMQRTKSKGRQFRDLLEQSQNQRQRVILYDPNTWSLITEYMHRNTRTQTPDPLLAFHQLALESVQNGIAISANSDLYRGTISETPGGILFLRGIGYQWNRDQTVLSLIPNRYGDQQVIVDAAVESIQSYTLRHHQYDKNTNIDRSTARISTVNRPEFVPPKIKPPEYSAECKIDRRPNENALPVLPIPRNIAPTPQQMEYSQSHGIRHFEKILQNVTQSAIYGDLLLQTNWDMLIEGMSCSVGTISVHDQVHSLKALRKLTQNVLRGDGREINADSDKFRELFAALLGVDSFLRGIGFVLIDSGTSTKYELMHHDVGQSDAIVNIALSAVSHKLTMLSLRMSLQKTCLSAMQHMYNNPFLQSQQEALMRLTAMDLSKDYRAYYELLQCAIHLGDNKFSKQKRKRVAVGIMKHYGVKLNGNDNIDRATINKVSAIYDAVRAIEMIRNEYLGTGHIKATPINIGGIHDAQDFPLSPTVAPYDTREIDDTDSDNSHSSYSTDIAMAIEMEKSSMKHDLENQVAEHILGQALEFGRYWNQKISTQDCLSQDDLDRVYDLDIEPGARAIEQSNPELAAKVQAVLEKDAQIKEYERYIAFIENFTGSTVEFEHKCEDEECKWNKINPPSIMEPHQVVHLMFYHSADYKELQRSRHRRARFQQTRRHRPKRRERNSGNTKLSSIIPDFTSSNTPTPTPRDRQRSIIKYNSLDPRHIRGSSLMTHARSPSLKNTPMNLQQIPSRSISYEPNDQLPIISMEGMDFDPIFSDPEGDPNEAPIEGGCNAGDRCVHLKRVIKSCRDITKLMERKENLDDIDAVYDLDHCLHFHSEFRVTGPGRGCKDAQCPSLNLFRGSVDRYIQFHRQIFHDQPIGVVDNMMEQKDQDDVKDGNNTIGYRRSGNLKRERIEFGQPFMIRDKRDAKFKDPKKEILHNEFHRIEAGEWNGLLRKCMIFAISREAKHMRLRLKEIVALKLYTDYDDLQRVFHQCFREDDDVEREKLQKNFYHWNMLLESACAKARYRVYGKLYHGDSSGKTLIASSLSGTYLSYFGPVSTTTDFNVAKDFAGDKGQIVELYPPFGRCGLKVSWLSNFPDEQEVLYVNTSFQISRVYESTAIAPHEPSESGIANVDSIENRLKLMESSIFDALQSINVGTNILSLNECDSRGCFANMGDRERVSVLDLLHLQYRPQLWEQLIKTRDESEHQSSRIIAVLNFRDQFITLIQNVRAVIMNKMSKSMEEFFCTEPRQYTLRSISLFHDAVDGAKSDGNHDFDFNRNCKVLYLSKIVQLFPKAEQVSISGKHWDWSLDRFIQFLESHDLDDHGLSLQYIDVEMDAEAAQEAMIQNEARENMYRLKEFGWKFITPTTLYRFGLCPEPEMPFMRTFVDGMDLGDDEGVKNMFVSRSIKLLLHPTPGGNAAVDKAMPSFPATHRYHRIEEDQEESVDVNTDSEFEMKEHDDGDNGDFDLDHIETRDNAASVASEGGVRINEIDYDPSCCTLSQQIFNILEYKEPLIQMLKWRLKEEDDNYKSDPQKETRFVAECERVESLVLDPLPVTLRGIFYDDFNAEMKGRNFISFKRVIRIFPNIKAVFVTSTTFTLRICLCFMRFIEEMDDSETLALEKVHFSLKKRTESGDVKSVQWRLKEIGWEFVESLQVIRKCEYDVAMQPDSVTSGASPGGFSNDQLLEEVLELGKLWKSSPNDPEEELTFYENQINEYWDYIQNTESIQEILSFAQFKCEDPECGWDKEVHDMALMPNQLVHLMLYHSADYKQIQKERRSTRFIQTTKGDDSTIGIKETVNHEISKVITADSPTTKGDVLDHALCPHGVDCEHLKRVIESCRDIKNLNESDDQYTVHDMDHCLLFHSDFRINGPPDGCTNALCLNAIVPSLGVNRFIQFHRQIFHDEPIGFRVDDENPKDINDMKMEQKEDDKISFKMIKYNGNPKRLEFGQPFGITDERDAKFKNHKEEVLNNDYYPLDEAQWTKIEKLCKLYQKGDRRSGLTLEELIALKVYTDCDKLQYHFRRSYREKDPVKRENLQKSFYHWNTLLESACKKSTYRVSGKLYHGVDDDRLMASCFSGTYYGPVSTTTQFRIAKRFAKENGKILELYPSFGRCGMNVYGISDFPDEGEILYMNTSFEISNIYDSSINEPPNNAENESSPAQSHLMAMEREIIKALQTINIGTDILSLNDHVNEGCFRNMDSDEMVVVLHLLYLQYRIELWGELAASAQDNPRISAILKFRDQFITLIDSVRAVIMNKMSKLLEWFFCAAEDEFDRLQSDKKAQLNQQVVIKHFRPNQSLYFPRIARLFPMAEQLLISGKNWDWSLNQFIQFLETHDLDHHGLALQYIDIEMDDNAAQEALIQNEARENMYRLKEIGWRFISPTKLYRSGVKPDPEKPFLRTFIDGNCNKSPVLYVRESVGLMLDPTPGKDLLMASIPEEIHEEEAFAVLSESEMEHPENDNDCDDVEPSSAPTHRIKEDQEDSDEMKEQDDDSNDDVDLDHIETRDNAASVVSEGGMRINEIDYDPSCCTLSQQIFSILEYKEPLIQMLKWRLKKDDDDDYESDEQKETRFVAECEMVESLVLDPLPTELCSILCIDAHSKRSLLSFERLLTIFPNVKALFVTSTTFNLRICMHFVDFVRGDHVEDANDVKLGKVYFSKSRRLRQRQFKPCQWRLREIGWEFVESEQILKRMV